MYYTQKTKRDNFPPPPFFRCRDAQFGRLYCLLNGNVALNKKRQDAPIVRLYDRLTENIALNQKTNRRKAIFFPSNTK